MRTVIEDYIDDFADDDAELSREPEAARERKASPQPAKRASAWRSVEEYWEEKRLRQDLADLDAYED